MSPGTAESVARAVLALGGVYAGLGVVFAAAFVTRGIERLDAGARGASWAFRLLILPASALLWPLLLYRWTTGRSAPPRERNAHDRAADPGEERA